MSQRGLCFSRKAERSSWASEVPREKLGGPAALRILRQVSQRDTLAMDEGLEPAGE